MCKLIPAQPAAQPEDQREYEFDYVYRKRPRKGFPGQFEYKVRWRGFDVSDDKWFLADQPALSKAVRAFEVRNRRSGMSVGAIRQEPMAKARKRHEEGARAR